MSFNQEEERYMPSCKHDGVRISRTRTHLILKCGRPPCRAERRLHLFKKTISHRFLRRVLEEYGEP